MTAARAIVIALDEQDAAELQAEVARSGYEVVAVLTPGSPKLDRDLRADAVLTTSNVDVRRHEGHKALHQHAIDHVTAE